jgi:hypothetical protein
MKKTLSAMFLMLSMPVSAWAVSTTVCPYKSDDLAKIFGVKFDAGIEEPGAGGVGCKYKTVGGSLKAGTDFSLWVFQFYPGSDQDMILEFTLGPGTKPAPVKDDPDGAQEKRGNGILDVFYKRHGWAVLLRTSLPLVDDDDTAAYARRRAQLLKLPRLH